MTTSQTNRRKNPRAPIKAKATLEVGPVKVPVVVRDIGVGGIFIAIQTEQLRIGHRHKVTLELPDQSTHVVTVEVRSIVDRGQKPLVRDSPGIGCAFVDVRPATVRAISQYIEKANEQYSQLQLGLALVPTPPMMPRMLESAGLNPNAPLTESKNQVNAALQGLRLRVAPPRR